MNTAIQSTRRDVRHDLRQGLGSIELAPSPAAPGGVSGALRRISVAGLCFRVERDAPWLRPGALIPGVQVRVGECVLDGEIRVRSVVPDRRGVEVGCLFHPSDDRTEERLMALIAGLNAAGSP